MFKSKSGRAAAKLAALRRRREQQQQLQQQQEEQELAAAAKQDYLDNCHRTYSCVHCRAHLADHDQLISKLFQGNHGRAYLFHRVTNVGCKQAVQRQLLTGLHAVADIYCDSCETTIGWKYEQAFVPSQKYKEGKYIIELAHILKENNWDLTSYNVRDLLEESKLSEEQQYIYAESFLNEGRFDHQRARYWDLYRRLNRNRRKSAEDGAATRAAANPVAANETTLPPAAAATATMDNRMGLITVRIVDGRPSAKTPAVATNDGRARLAKRGVNGDERDEDDDDEFTTTIEIPANISVQRGADGGDIELVDRTGALASRLRLAEDNIGANCGLKSSSSLCSSRSPSDMSPSAASDSNGAGAAFHSAEHDLCSASSSAGSPAGEGSPTAV